MTPTSMTQSPTEPLTPDTLHARLQLRALRGEAILTAGEIGQLLLGLQPGPESLTLLGPDGEALIKVVRGLRAGAVKGANRKALERITDGPRLLFTDELLREDWVPATRLGALIRDVTAQVRAAPPGELPLGGDLLDALIATYQSVELTSMMSPMMFSLFVRALELPGSEPLSDLSFTDLPRSLARQPLSENPQALDRAWRLATQQLLIPTHSLNDWTVTAFCGRSEPVAGPWDDAPGASPSRGAVGVTWPGTWPERAGEPLAEQTALLFDRLDLLQPDLESGTVYEVARRLRLPARVSEEGGLGHLLLSAYALCRLQPHGVRLAAGHAWPLQTLLRDLRRITWRRPARGWVAGLRTLAPESAPVGRAETGE